MNRTIGICAMMMWGCICVVTVISSPEWLSDKNKFLREFIGPGYLELMGVIVTITLSSTANIYIELNKLDDRVGKSAFPKTRRHVRHSAYGLILGLVFSLGILVVKSLLNLGVRGEAIINGSEIAILIGSIMIVLDITEAAFSLDTRAK